MATSAERHVSDQPARQAKIFADLWRRNERAARVAELLDARRKRRIEQGLRAERQRGVHPQP